MYLTTITMDNLAMKTEITKTNTIIVKKNYKKNTHS